MGLEGDTPILNEYCIQGSLMRVQSSGDSMKIYPQKWVRSLSEKIGTLSIEGGL